MAGTPEAPHIGSATLKAESPDERSHDSGNLKRKASLNQDDTDAGSPKRTKAGRDHDRNDRSRSPQSRRRSSLELPTFDDPTRRTSATVEEKKRGKRLFGGLLNTLSQTNVNSQQKRRQEIQKRQQERVNQQQAEDDLKRKEKLAELQSVRMAEQINFEERVMQNKHSKMLWVAKHLKTRAEPAIYYLPWKLTRAQEDLIDDQIRDAKDIVARERDAFKARERRHKEKHGFRRLSPPAPSTNPAPTGRNVQRRASEAASRKGEEGRSTTKAERDHHDDTGDVVVEADEDTVIY